MMKSITVFLLTIALSGCGQQRGDETASNPDSIPLRATVETLMQSPKNFLSQPVAVRGVVSRHGKAANVFMLISDEEFAKCGLTNCAEFELPVRLSGVAPAIGDSVIVEGAIHQESGKFAFVATKLRRLAHETSHK
jgi:exonuclease VII large subunit